MATVIVGQVIEYMFSEFLDRIAIYLYTHNRLYKTYTNFRGAEVESRLVKMEILQLNESMQYSQYTVTLYAMSCLSLFLRFYFLVL